MLQVWNFKLKKNGAELSEKYVKYENLGPEFFFVFSPPFSIVYIVTIAGKT